MNSKQRIGLAIGGGIIAVAAAVGVGAAAANLGGTGTTQGVPGYGQNGGGQGGGGQQMDTTAMATALATKLGVDEAKMKTALDNALQASRPSGNASGGPGGGGTPGAAPSGAAPSGAAPSGNATPGGNGGGQRTEMLTAVAKSIASELNLDQAKVLAALQEVWTSTGGNSAQPSAQPTS